MELPVIKAIAPVAMIAAAAACGSDSTGPQQSGLAGSYSAYQWVTTGESGQTFQLVIGSTLQITLSDNGSTSGHMHIAASNGNPSADFDLAGTWRQTGNNVNFSQTVDNFLNDVTFTIQPIATGVWDLVGVDDFPGTHIELTLRHGP